jgi:hypothetical protein
MTGSMVAVWKGPFVGNAYFAADGKMVQLSATSTPSTAVLNATASQLQNTDPTWWTLR